MEFLIKEKEESLIQITEFKSEISTLKIIIKIYDKMLNVCLDKNHH